MNSIFHIVHQQSPISSESNDDTQDDTQDDGTAVAVSTTTDVIIVSCLQFKLIKLKLSLKYQI